MLINIIKILLNVSLFYHFIHDSDICFMIMMWSDTFDLMYNPIQSSHFSGDTKFHVFSRLFPGKCNEIPGQFGFESVFLLIMQIWQRCKSDLFWKWHLEKWSLNNKIYKVQVFFPGFELKFQVFQFLSKLQAFSRPRKVNDKIPRF